MANRYRGNPRYQTQQSDPKLDRLQQVMELGEPQRQDQAQRQGLALQLLEQLTGMQNARQRAAQGEAELGLQREAMQQRGAQDNRALEAQTLRELAPTSAAAMAALAGMFPSLGQAQQQVTQQQTGEQVRQLNPVLSALYQQGTPERPVLDALKQTYPLGFESPDVPWDTLNQGLQQPQPGAGSRLIDFIASGAGIPKLAQNPQVQDTAKTAFDAIYEKFFNPALTQRFQQLQNR